MRDTSERPFKPWHGVILGMIFLVFIVLRWVVPLIIAPAQPPLSEPGIAAVTVGSSTFSVLLANTPQLAYRGLSDRPNLGSYGGMLFVFPTTQERTFVMRDMLFPLDMVWVSEGVITDITPHLPLEPGATNDTLTPYTGKLPVNMVLEVASGTVDRLGWQLGDSVRVQY